MKAILVATDFSTSANSAVNYAANLADKFKAKLVIFHSYTVPVILSEVPIMMPNLEEIEKDSIKHLKLTKSTLLEKYKHSFEIEYECVCGFTLEVLHQFLAKNPIDLVVVGMHGAGAMTEKLVGSVTTTIINEVKCPVICVNEKSHYKPYHKIVFACDLGDFKNANIFTPIKEFVNLFDAKLLILNVFSKDHTEPTISEAVAGLKLDQVLADVNHQLCYIEHKDVIQGINEFVKEHKAELVIMMPRHHSFLNKLFNEPHTKKMAFHSEVPLLSVHE